mmetsp:Transcript_49241/g.157506  ORF Transcript_49241/g.157506 Transcript_49241/m.157506 type:complete len:363 (-) Transcript_49241:75-1163(-)
MADSLLSSAQSKLEEAEAFAVEPSSFEYQAVQQVIWNKASEALTTAKQALVTFRKAGNVDGRLRSLDVAVKASLMLDDPLEAKLYAEDELAMIKRTGDKKAIPKFIEMVVKCHTARGDGGAALIAATELLELQKELGDRAGIAQAMQMKAGLRIQLGQHKGALENAEEALKLFKEMGDEQGQEAALRTISQAYCERGQRDKAPNREGALLALEALQAALKALDKQAWEIAMQKLDTSGAYTQRDVEDLVAKALTREDRKAVVNFLQDQGVDIGAVGACPRQIVGQVEKTEAYLAFRMMGMGYGPRFRCMQAYGVSLESEPRQFAPAALQVSEDADDWEKDLYLCHPGVLDGTLQSVSTFGLA